MSNYNFGINEPPHRRWPVAWYSPAVLLRSAQELVSSGDLLRNFDRRELITAPFEIVDLAKDHNEGDFWWDFMSDSGDGGNATYTVARAMQAESLIVGLSDKLTSDVKVPSILPSGSLLVFGGDLAYPGASAEEYQYRFIEMWEAARPDSETEQSTVLAIPQNHDWFDNISSFHRYFIGDHTHNFLCADTPQTRSYFTARMPHGWWMFGLDFALVGDLDRTQFETFLEIVQLKMLPGDNVVLLYPEPYWTRPLGDNARQGYPKRYQRLEAALMERGIKVRMRLAGDLHHYVRETASDGEGLDYQDMLVTCGSGGAFLHPTHTKQVNQCKVMNLDPEEGWMTSDLEKRVRVGSQGCHKETLGQRVYSDRVCYPDQKTSKKLSWGNIFALFKPAAYSGLFPETVDGNFLQRPWRRMQGIDWSCLSGRSIIAGNFMYPIILGVLYGLTVYCNSFVFTESFMPDGFIPSSQLAGVKLSAFLQLWLKALLFSPLALGVHIVLLGVCCGIAREDGIKAAAIGLFHGFVHVFVAATLFWCACQVALHPFWRALILIPSGIVVGGLVVGIYFALMAWLGYLTNNAFSPLGHQGYKGFLRFRIDAGGNLHGYMVGTDSVSKRWKPNPDAKAGRPVWVEQNPKDAPQWKVMDAFVLKR